MPTLLIIKLVISLVCGALDALGGFCFLPARRFILPFVLAVSVSIFLHIWWIGALILPVIGTLCLGYKDFGSGKFSRGFWLFVQYVLVGLGLFLTHHLSWYVYIPYCVLGGILGGSLVDVFQPIGDMIEGIILGAILLFIH